MKQLAAIQLVGNAAALLLGYYWLSIGEARARPPRMELHGCALHCRALPLDTRLPALASMGSVPARRFCAALRRLPALLIAAIVVPAPLRRTRKAAGRLRRSLIPFRLVAHAQTPQARKARGRALGVVTAIFWLIRWIVLPMLLLPWLHVVLSRGAGLPACAGACNGHSASSPRHFSSPPSGYPSAFSTGAR